MPFVTQEFAEVLRAVMFAVHRHGDQKRRYTGEPYFHHVLAVASRVAMRTSDLNTINAAILHDVIEDTDATYDDVRRWFGEGVANIVLELTDHYTDGYVDATGRRLNRTERKRLESQRLSTISRQAMLVKAYDLIDNTLTIVLYDPQFAKVYLREKAAAVAAFGEALKEHDPHVYMELVGSLEKAERDLVQSSLSKGIVQ